MSRTPSSSLLIGIHSVDSALTRAPQQLQGLTVAEECRNPRVQELARRAREAGIGVETQARAVLDRRSEDERHQDIIAEFIPSNTGVEKDLDGMLDAIDTTPLVLVLDGVQDPHNLGACLRTAEAAGVNLVILPKDRSAGLTPAARRSASGAAEVLPILFVTNMARVLRRLKERGIWLAGTSDQAGQSLFDADLSGPVGLVMGSEGKGMRRLTSELCDFHMCIPMQGSVSSLNVSVATAVCLYEVVRQRRG
ncbi:MAG: 23S rRNA (guanosine(2251)-2'-O)-methyltransferase RlmB [Gammaproteobacteria bacterium]|nr:23S rRNA (guanosine(2251)-2'-O)-methyltransferase RlmB [Gammaproteobacteria bacterium]